MSLRTRHRQLSGATLPWAPPTLSSPTTIHVTEAAQTRYIEAGPNDDLIIELPKDRPVSYVPNPVGVAEDAIITVVGGRNVVVIGGWINVDRVISTRMTQYVDAYGMTLHVASTAGFPSNGVLRVDGEGILYDSKTETTFNVTQRRYGFYAGFATLPDTPHDVGAVVYLEGKHRTGLSVRSASGFVHREGLRVDGPGLLDGMRIRGGRNSTDTIQNCRVGPVSPVEQATWTDGHADCIQTWDVGVKELRLSHLTLRGGVGGRCILNAANSGGNGAVQRIDLRDLECVDASSRKEQLVTNNDAATEWSMANAWLRTRNSPILAAPQKYTGFMLDRDIQGPDLIPEGSVGLGYRSPGYR